MRLPGLDRRNRFVVNARLQRQLVLGAILPLLLVLAISLGAQLYLDVQLANELAKHDLELNEVVSRPTSTLLYFVFAVGYVALVALRFSHRVAGAAYRIGETLRSVRAGDRQARARLRDGDFLVDLADEVNAFLDWSEQGAPGGGEPEPRPSSARPGPAAREQAPAYSEKDS